MSVLTLARKTFTATPGFIELQTGEGPLTHVFRIGEVESRRMVVPYQTWMLGRIAEAIAPCIANDTARASLSRLLSDYDGGDAFLSLEAFLAGARVRKEGALLFSTAD